MPHETFKNYLKELIVGDENPENVVLLEIFPEKQKTAIDFALTEQLLGIKTVCLTKVKKEGKNCIMKMMANRFRSKGSTTV
jgi:hypothetical protein